jgi:hypothetical protein
MHRSIVVSLMLIVVVAACGGPSPSVTTASPGAPTSAASMASDTPSATPTLAPTPTPVAAVRNPAVLTGPAPYAPAIDPADFSTTIDNPFLPWTPGAFWAYEGGNERIEITVTPETRLVMGVTTVVVRDQVFVDGKLFEDTFDWYAQDRFGNVWYFGEATLSYEDDPAGDPAGSWEAGVDGAQPGIVMLADPWVGDVYRQEYLVGEAEDVAMIRAIGGSIKVPFGDYTDVLVTEDWTMLMPEQIEHKTYARGIGFVHETVVAGDPETVVLIEYKPAG